MVTGTSFHALKSSSSPGLCEVFELGIDRANEVELPFASPAFELFFPSDGCANVFVTLKVEIQALSAQQSSLPALGKDRGGPQVRLRRCAQDDGFVMSWR
jgi:hypothetical protein